MKSKDRYGWGVATFILGALTLLSLFTGIFLLAGLFGVATLVVAANNEEKQRQDSI